MTDETELVQDDQSRAEMEAAFAASDDADVRTVEAPSQKAPAEETKQTAEEPKDEKPADTPAPVEAPAPAAPTTLSDDQLRLLAAIPELERRLTQQVDKVAGNYGEVKRLLGEMQKAAATPKGAAEFGASDDMVQFEQDFAEIANPVKQMIEARLSNLPHGISEEQLEAYFTAREVEQRKRAIEDLDSIHPDRLDIIHSKEWGEWMSSLPKYRQAAIANSNDLHYVAGEISAFKERSQAQAAREKELAAQAEKSKSRVENAMTPSGVRHSTKSTISEDEAMRQAFAEADKM